MVVKRGLLEAKDVKRQEGGRRCGWDHQLNWHTEISQWYLLHCILIQVFVMKFSMLKSKGREWGEREGKWTPRRKSWRCGKMGCCSGICTQASQVGKEPGLCLWRQLSKWTHSELQELNLNIAQNSQVQSKVTPSPHGIHSRLPKAKCYFLY